MERIAHRKTAAVARSNGAKPRVAIIGSGISGLSAAWALQDECDVTVFEKNDKPGGHTNTVIVESPDGPVPVDTGFIVYNEPNYPNLTALFDHLSVATNEARMHFSVSARERDMEYASHSVSGLFADLRNLTRPRFFSMIADIFRFYAAAPELADSDAELSLGAFLDAKGYSEAFKRDHILPMAAAIWSCRASAIMNFPAKNLARFFINHGLTELNAPFKWRSVDGGSDSYIAPLTFRFRDQIRLNTKIVSVNRRAGGVEICTSAGERLNFDHVVLACHGPHAHCLLSDADERERSVISAFRTQANRAVLHTDPRLMPRRRRAWASWNYLSEREGEGDLSVTYWMNSLQRLATNTNYFVTLNPTIEPDPQSTVVEFDYEHPVFDARSMQAQRDIWPLQGHRNTWYCGAYLGYGFHEDGLQAGLAVAELMSNWRRPWNFDRSRERLIRPAEERALAA